MKSTASRLKRETSSEPPCTTCHHGTHAAGMCKACNCGESEVIWNPWGGRNPISMEEGWNRYVPPPTYTRKGDVRDRPLHKYRNDKSTSYRRPAQVYPEDFDGK
jgi:hypothetical protein